MPVRPAVRYAKARLLGQTALEGKRSLATAVATAAVAVLSARPALTAPIAAGTVRAAPTRNGQAKSDAYRRIRAVQVREAALMLDMSVHPGAFDFF